MIRLFLFLLLSIFFSLVSVNLAEPQADAAVFTLERQIGRLQPQAVRYDPNFDRFAWVDHQNWLLLVNAPNHQMQHVLYTSGAYNAYEFSPDGHWLALALERRIELWNTQTGQRVGQFEPTGANLVVGPLHFTPDSKYLLFDTIVPAPQALRRSENDTSIIPWLWDLEAARGERRSRFPNLEDGYPFYEYRNGLVIGANTTLIGAMPNRLMIMDGSTNNFSVVNEIATQRAERDPMRVWRSATDLDLLYTDNNDYARIDQIHIPSNTVSNIPLNRDYRPNIALDSILHPANNSRELCPFEFHSSSLARWLGLGQNFRNENSLSLRVFLLDVLEPMTMEESHGGLLLYFSLPQYGIVDFLRPYNTAQIRLSPDNTRLLVRTETPNRLEIYNLDTCAKEKTIYLHTPQTMGQYPLAFNADGSQIINGFQRFDVATGMQITSVIDHTLTPFAPFSISTDSRSVTVQSSADEWQIWDLTTGQRIGTYPALPQGQNIIAQQTGDLRFLLSRPSYETVVLSQVDLRQQSRKELIIHARGWDETSLRVSPDWRYIAGLRSLPGTQYLEIYNFDEDPPLTLTIGNLPSAFSSIHWIDDVTLQIVGDGSPLKSYLYGLNYTEARYPACLPVDSPEAAARWSQVWDELAIMLSQEDFHQLTQRLCDSMPQNDDEILLALTPPAQPQYLSHDAMLQNIPGVPVCLTERFSSQAAEYAALWRQLSANLNEDEKTELETMLCESNLNPLQIQSVIPNEDLVGLSISINVETQTRYVTNYRQQPVIVEDVPNLALYTQHFEQQFNRLPNTPQISPNGEFLLENSDNGMINVYRVNQAALLSMQPNATPDTTVRSIGLIPTATQAYQSVGPILPLPTPTIMPTAIPLVEQGPESWLTTVEYTCPMEPIADIDAGHMDAASGRILLQSEWTSYESSTLIDLDKGISQNSYEIPICLDDENCSFSPDRQWIMHRPKADDLTVISRPDGTQATPINTEYPIRDFRWQPDNTFSYTQFSRYVPIINGSRPSWRDLNPHTGLFSDFYHQPEDITPIRVGNLLAEIIERQPGGDLYLIRIRHHALSKYYLYDITTLNAEHIIDSVDSTILYEWHPSGDTLYYNTPDADFIQVYTVATGEHHRIPMIPQFYTSFITRWSPEGNYKLIWDYDGSFIPPYELSDNAQIVNFWVWDRHTGAQRAYCLPTQPAITLNSMNVVWSPDEAFIAFNVLAEITSSLTPTPNMGNGNGPHPTPSPLPDQPWDDIGNNLQHPVILNLESGMMTSLTQTHKTVTQWMISEDDQ